MDDKNKRSCGRTGGLITAYGEDCYGDKGPGTLGHTCIEIAGSEGKEDPVMNCCYTWRRSIWVSYIPL